MLLLYHRPGDIVTVCAIPDRSTPPDFLSADGWVFLGQSSDISEQLTEPDRVTYEAVLAETGFYVFTPARPFDPEPAADTSWKGLVEEPAAEDAHVDLEPLVKERAYFLWEEAGCPLGREHEFWAAASREIEADVRARLERRHAGRHVAR